MANDYTVVVERDEDRVFVASMPSLPGCHTQARSLDELLERIKEATASCLDADRASELGLIPLRLRLPF